MGQFTQNGVTYEELPDGNVRVVSVAASPTAGRIFTLPQNPDEVRERGRQDKKDAQDAIKFNERNDPQLKPGYRWKDGKVGGEAEPIPGIAPEGEKQKTEDRDRLSRLNQLAAQINRVQELYDKDIGPEPYGVLSSLGDYGWGDANSRFDAAGAALSQQGLAAFRVPGTGTVSDRDAIMFDRANLPTAATRDAAIEEQLLGLRSRVDAEMEALGQPKPNWVGVAQQNADNEVPQANGAATKPPPQNPSGTPPENGSGNPPTPWDGPNAPPGNTIATGPTRTERSDRLSAQVDAMMNAGASKAMIDAVLQQQGYPAISPESYTKARGWMQDHPGKSYFGSDITREHDLSLMSRIAGSETGSALANYADTATAGIGTSLLAGEKGRGALDAMRQVNPDPSAVGSVLGGITGAAGAEIGVAARAPAALRAFAPRIADTLYGGVSGFNNAQEGEGGTGAFTGAAAGLLGGILGERVVRGVGNLATGVRNPNAQALREAGVPMTVGQAVGDSGVIGAGVKKLEDAGTSLPFVGNMIEARRMDGLRGFNDAAFGTAAAPGAQITARGAEGMGQVRQSVRNAYSQALDPVTIDANDPQFIADIVAARAAADRIPDVQPTDPSGFANGALRNRIDGGIDPNTDTMTGRNFQEAYRGLGRSGRERANSDYGFEVGQVMRQGQDALGEALERQNPGAFEGFLEANAANRRANVLADALKNAGNQSEELVTPAQLNRADIASTSRLTGKIDSAEGNRPFYDLATAGQAILPSRLPDSGTATRAAVVGGLGLTGLAGAGYGAGGGEGAVTGAGLGLGATLLAALGGSRPAQQVATRMLLDRPDLAVRIGEQINRNARIGGWAGAGTLTPFVVGQ